MNNVINAAIIVVMTLVLAFAGQKTYEMKKEQALVAAQLDATCIKVNSRHYCVVDGTQVQADHIFGKWTNVRPQKHPLMVSFAREMANAGHTVK